MNAPNLAICVAPVIVTASGGGSSLANTMESMGRAQGLVRDLIVQCKWIFENDEEVADDQTTEAKEAEVTKEDELGVGVPDEQEEIQPVIGSI